MALYRTAAHPSPPLACFSELLRRIDFIVVRRRMPMPSPHSEQSVSEHIASRRSWRNLMYRMSFLHCQPHNFNKAVRAQVACPGAWRKGFSGSGEALNLFFFGLPQNAE